MKSVSGAFIPDRVELDLLKAALLPDSRALEHWRAWQGAVELDDIAQGSFHLLPQLYRNLTERGVAASELARYKGVYRYFWVHTRNVTRAALDVVRQLDGHGIPSLVVKGVALRHLYYPDPYARTFGDLDLLVRYEDYPEARRVLYESGAKAIGLRGDRQIQIRHAANFQVSGKVHLDLHWHLLQQCCHAGADGPFWDSAAQFDLDGQVLGTLCDTDHLLHTLVHASHRKEHKLLRWVCDAHHLLAAGAVDWERLVGLCRDFRIATPVALACRFLVEEMQQPIPGSVIDDLESSPATPHRERELALYSEQRGPLSAIPLLWHGYLDRHPEQGMWTRTRGFAWRLREWCGADSWAGLVAVLSRAVIARLRGQPAN